MRIVIDARMIGQKQHGIARHTSALIRYLEKINPPHRFTLLVTGDTLKGKTGFELKKINAPWISVREQFELPKVLKQLGADLFHSPSFVMPYVCPVPFVLTIHDLIHIAFQEGRRLTTTLYYNTLLKSALKKAKKIIAVSKHTQKDLMKHFNVSEDRIQVVHNGLDPRFQPIASQEALTPCRKRFGLPEKFILYVGNAKKHKNFDRMLTAYRMAETDVPLAAMGLAAMGLRPAGLPSPSEKIKQIYFLPQVEDADLPHLYNLSTLVVFPSLYEGFGFPALEAMACGKRLITSNTTSLPEVAGDAATLVDPYNPAAIASAIRQALREKESVNQKGIEQAQKFSWDTAARQTLELYENCDRT